MTTATAWPFLIARGRRRGYSVLAAPAFLIHDGEQGCLEDVVGPPPARVATRAARTPRGRHLHLVWADHRVVGADVGDTTDPVDEHSRPLRLLYGYLCQDTATDPTPAALDRALAAALTTYRRFLRAEETFTVEESTPFTVAARVAAPAPPPPPARPVALLAAAAVFTLLALLTGVLLVTGDDQPRDERLVGPDTTVQGTIEAPGQQDTYALGTGTTTAITLQGERPPTLVVRLHDRDDGTELLPNRTHCWQVTPNTEYRLTVTSPVGDYTFRLAPTAGCAATRKNPPG